MRIITKAKTVLFLTSSLAACNAAMPLPTYQIDLIARPRPIKPVWAYSDNQGTVYRTASTSAMVDILMDTTPLTVIVPRPTSTSPIRALGGVRTITLTAYNSVPGQTDASPCISADGSDVCKLYEQGATICASNDFPMHSTITIEGVGDCLIRDRMNTRYTGQGYVDLFMGYDVKAATAFGVRKGLTATLKR